MFKVIFLLWSQIILINIGVPKLSITPNFDFNLYYDSQYAYLYIHKKTRGHIAVGFGQRQMTGSNVVIVNKRNNGSEIFIRDCYAYGRFPFNCKATPLFEIMERDININKIEVLLRRRIIVSEPLSNNFNTNDSTSFIYSYTDRETIQFHYGPTCKYGNFVIFQSTLMAQVSEEVYPVPGGIQHSFQNIFIWVFLCDILIFVVRFLKTVKFYNIIHAFCFTAICIYTFVIIGDIWSKRIFSGRNYPPHFYASIFILIFTILEFITGIFLQLKIHFNLGRLNVSISKEVARKIHGVLGLFCWISVRVGCYYGTSYLFFLYNISVYLYILIAETVVFLLLFIMSSVYYLGNKKFVKVVQNNVILKQKDSNEILKTINNSNYFELKEITKLFDKKIIVFYKNRVYNIQNIIHPGGEYIFKEMKFRDVTRFLFGSYGLESNNSENWLHSNFAHNLLEKHYMGNLKLEYTFLHNSKNIKKYMLSDYKEFNFNWNIYYFKNENVEIQNHVSKLSEIATYFNIKNKEGTWRNYTTILSASKYNLELNKKLLDYVNSLIDNNNGYNFEFKPENYEKNILPFVIKTYKSKIGVSEYLSNLKKIKNAEVEIEGPFGEGLHLNQKNNDISIITGGTGILPVYDLIDLVFKKLCNQYLQSKNINLNIPELHLGEWINNIKITLISSFQSDKEFYGILYLDMISKLQKIIDVNYIDINIRFSKTPSQDYNFELYNGRLNHNLISEKIKNKNNNVYICGPPTLNNSAYNILMSKNYKRVYMI